MLGSDLIKAIVDKNLVDKEIVIIGNANETSEVEGEGAQIDSVHLVEDLGTGIIVFEGYIEQ